ncbi:hypothetical protein BJ875DRAFT_256908 [Amylocarpus encephaloides]|uniref:Uncharacterized protein n=1 Tax=Amylocarpus encephaloides TaxID=45428 RepID=A0A9P8C727_9HELO|nr:hypothetical protein BJ875DRAFT_256908 [Amylocarpus encephaloides]
MTRKLPWDISKAGRVKRSPSHTTPKRRKTKRTGSETPESEGPQRRRFKSTTPGREPSTSPPPEPPPESFMSDGMDHDDKYRMVEDEFLSVAQLFTVHLHTTEYKRQQIQVKSCNAEAIHSISRPVTGQMPNQTKRKLESAERSKLQRTAVDGMLKKESKDPVDSDDSDTGDLPYVGTTLHGLMDSPRKKAASLAGGTSLQLATRAAAGFTKGVRYKSSPTRPQNFSQRSSVGRSRPHLGHESAPDSTDDGEDDDLDGPVSALKLPKREVKVEIKQELTSLSLMKSLPDALISREKSVSRFKTSTATGPIINPLPKITSLISDCGISASNQVPRSDHLRRQRPKRELKAGDSKKLDVIPNFL